jgi:DNA-binding transcriptional MerR regulator
MELIPRFAKHFYTFKEVTSMTGVKPYVLRFWESEFVQITSETDDSGNKHYSKESVELINKIKSMLFDQKMSIQMVKARLESEVSPEEVNVVLNNIIDDGGVSITYEKRSQMRANQVNVEAPSQIYVTRAQNLSPVKKELEEILKKIEDLEKRYLSLNN